ncbi:MAG: DUF481 domain-containing protein, partial [Planctomycetia bacterium]
RQETESDQARLINVRSITSTGLGFRFIDQLHQRLIARTGPTISYTSFESDVTDDSLQSGWFFEGEYRRAFWGTTRFEWTSTLFPNFDNERQLRVRNDAAILFPIAGVKSGWAWKIGVLHEYQMDPIPTTSPSDVNAYFSIAFQN